MDPIVVFLLILMFCSLMSSLFGFGMALWSYLSSEDEVDKDKDKDTDKDNTLDTNNNNTPPEEDEDKDDDKDEEEVEQTGCDLCTAEQYCSNDTCYDKLAQGADCQANMQCQSGFDCILGKCAAKLGQGEACTSLEQCQSGLGCIDLKCAPFRTSGQACSTSLDCDLRQNLKCENSICVPRTFSFNRPLTKEPPPCPTIAELTDVADPAAVVTECQKSREGLLICPNGFINDFFYNPYIRNPNGTMGKYQEGYSCKID